MSRYILVALVSVVLSSLAQILLKKSSAEEKRHLIFDYLNVKVAAAYGIIFFCMLLVIYAFTGMHYRYGAVIESLAYLLIMLFSRAFLKEKLTRRRVIGNCIIVLGVLIFTISI
ncbi:MAG: EamA family transporter [Oscillospiraceae bacterium]|nr:EamA family transporter [Oscillospiraceae bacterium]